MITFTQYLRPNGRRRQEEFACDEETQAKADAIIAAGYVFECEVLMDDITCSFTIGDPKKEIDVAIEICPNGPRVPETVKKLVTNFYQTLNNKEQSKRA